MAKIIDPDDYDINISSREIVINNNPNEGSISTWDLNLYLKTNNELRFPDNFSEVDKLKALDLINYGELLYPITNEPRKEIIDFVNEYFKWRDNE